MWLLGIYLNRLVSVVFFQAEDGIRDLVRSRGLGDVYKRQVFKHFARAGLPVLGICLEPNAHSKTRTHKTGVRLSLIHI